MPADDTLRARRARLREGGAPNHHAKTAGAGTLFARERPARLLDPASFVEEGSCANTADPDLPADGVVTGLGKMSGRTVALMANDSTVKAGSWGARTVENILRIQDTARNLRGPRLYLVDSAGVRTANQLETFPRRPAPGLDL